MTIYLISRPGRPLHLTVWSWDPQPVGAGTPSYGKTGRYVPLCGLDRGTQPPWRKTSRITGELCRYCQNAYGRLHAAYQSATRESEQLPLWLTSLTPITEDQLTGVDDTAALRARLAGA